MADPICRWRNVTIKQVCEFTNILPHHAMPKNQAHEIIERKWLEWDGSKNFFRTAYQLAASLGLYYEDDLMFYPRFCKVLSFEESHKYLNGWCRRYYVPNPYTASVGEEKGIFVLNSLLLSVIDKGVLHTLKEALEKNYEFVLGNEDIIKNMLNLFSDINVSDDGTLSRKADPSPIDEIEIKVSKTDKKAFFEFFNDIPISLIGNTQQNKYLRQTIFYGAPGTGKSHEVKKYAKNCNSIRTTFHPDSDYSTFVGAYKPTMGTKPLYGLFGDKTVRFKADGNELNEETISYKFVPQAFLKAYCTAWRKWSKGDTEPFYLVIEEINRGNCAQIFGDLFQLLDRDCQTGFSTYAIEADEDISRFICEDEALKLSDIIVDDIWDKDGDTVATGEDIAKGKKLVLPPNLYIWATMNTSDQSLFPIDSAFKRRWDWEYIPIKYSNKDWFIEIGESAYSWVSFQTKVNNEIQKETHSEDKKLGDFFVTAKDNKIEKKVFLNKVLFYLWNDAFKDGESDLFQINPNAEFTFSDFYGEKGNEMLINFMNKLGVEEMDDVSDEENTFGNHHY